MGSGGDKDTEVGIPFVYALMGAHQSERRSKMGTYIMLSNLTDEGAKTLKGNPERIREVNKEIEEMGVKVLAQYAVLGPYDFVNIVEAPDNETITRVSLELSSRGTVRIATLAAIPVEDLIRCLKG